MSLGKVLEIRKSKSLPVQEPVHCQVGGVNTALRVSCHILLCGCFWLVVLKLGDLLVLCQSASGYSTVFPKAGHHGGSVPPLTNYQTSILADFAGKGFGKNGPVQATEVRLFSSRSPRTV